jgi:hypothetical protein
MMSYSAVTLWQLGYPDQALARSNQAIAQAREKAHPARLAAILDFAAWFNQLRREWRAAQEQTAAAIALSTEQGLPYWLAVGTILGG